MSDFLKNYGQPLVYKIIHPLILGMAKLGITPNTITFFGFAINLFATGLLIYAAQFEQVSFAHLGWAGAIILFGGLFDMMDGRLARVSGLSSTYGALFDSVLDRYSELVMFLGLCYFLITQDFPFGALFTFLSLIGSTMVSYVRARAEGLGIECSGGLMQRPERIILIGGAAILTGVISYYSGTFSTKISIFTFDNMALFSVPMLLLAILSNLTAFQRLNHCRKALQ